jgi:DNA helicase II / ATP-dependent DNA helicase PcrA
VNHASGELLRELIEPGQGPWVVGDVKQSIYRFRGASPLNMSRFESRFPGAQHTDLEVNYRSGGKIVRTFEAFGLKMQSAHLSTTKPLKAHRGDNSGRVDFDVATTREAEYEGIGSPKVATYRPSPPAVRSRASVPKAVRQLRNSEPQKGNYRSVRASS